MALKLKQKTMVIPAQAGIQDLGNMWPSWIPACAGMTNNEIFGLRAPLLILFEQIRA